MHGESGPFGDGFWSPVVVNGKSYYFRSAGRKATFETAPAGYAGR